MLKLLQATIQLEEGDSGVFRKLENDVCGSFVSDSLIEKLDELHLVHSEF